MVWVVVLDQQVVRTLPPSNLIENSIVVYMVVIWCFFVSGVAGGSGTEGSCATGSAEHGAQSAPLQGLYIYTHTHTYSENEFLVVRRRRLLYYMNAIINYKAPRRGLVGFFYNYAATACVPGMGAAA